jgi:hypothetical protein
MVAKLDACLWKAENGSPWVWMPLGKE